MEPITKQNIGETTGILIMWRHLTLLNSSSITPAIFKHRYEKVESLFDLI